MTEKLPMVLMVTAIALGCSSPDAGPQQTGEPAPAEKAPAEPEQEILSGDFENGTTEEWAGATDESSEPGPNPEEDGPEGSS